MRQSLDIADVERQTKIRAKYLRALENEEFGMLPGPTFVKTFLRTYAEVLGLDPHTLVEEYRAHYESRDELDAIKPLGPQGSPRRERRRGPGPRPWMIAGVLVLAVLAGLIALGYSADDDGGGGGGQATATDTGEQTTTAAGQPEEPQPREPRPAPTRVVVRITPEVPTYACIDRGPDTEVIYEGTLESAQTFRGPRVRVNLGKTAVDVSVNGREIPIEPSPEALGLEFTPGKTTPLPLGERPCA